MDKGDLDGTALRLGCEKRNDPGARELLYLWGNGRRTYLRLCHGARRRNVKINTYLRQTMPQQWLYSQ